MRKVIGLLASILSLCASLEATPSCSLVSTAGAGTVQISSAGAVTGTSTSFSSAMVNTSSLCIGSTCAFITAYSSATSITVGNGSWSGTTSGGQTYTIAQLAHPVTNTMNTVTFLNNFTAGDTLLFGGWLDANGDYIGGLWSGLGEPFTFTPSSNTLSGYSLWLGYLPSTLGGTNLINLGVVGGDFIDDVYGAEVSCTGGIPVFDVDGTNSGTPPTTNLSVSSTSGVVWAVAAGGGGTMTGIASPYTSSNQSSNGGIFGVAFNQSGTVITKTNPGTAFGYILGASLKLVQPNPVGNGGTGGFGGISGYNAPARSLTIGSPLVCGNGSGGLAFTSSGTAAITAPCDTTGATLLILACNVNAAADTITPSDSAGNTWTLANTQSFASYNIASVYYVYNPVTSATHTFTCTSSGTASVVAGAEAVQSTPKTQSVYDFSVGTFLANATVYPSYVSSYQTSGTVGTGSLPKAPGEFLFLFCGMYGSPTSPAISSPFTLDATNGTNTGGWMGHYIDTSGAGVNPYCASGGGSGITAILAGFQPAFSRLPQAATPTFSPTPGTYSSTQTATISAANGSIICFTTTGGGVPATNGLGTACSAGTQYSSGITVSATESIYAVSGGATYADSEVAVGAYTISPLIAHAIKQGSGTITTAATNTTGATLLTACVSGYPSGFSAGSGTTGPITDSNSNTWHYLTVHNTGNGDVRAQIAYALSPTVGSGQTFTMTTTSYDASIAVAAWALSGTPSFDQQNGAISNSSASLATGNITPSVANELLFTCWGSNGNSVAGLGVSGSFSIINSITGAQGSTLADAYYIDPATSAIGATWSQTTATEEAVFIGSFEP